MTKSVQMYFAPFVDSLPSKSDLSLHTSGAFLSKRCPKCKVEKLLNEFTKNRSRKDGADDWCKQCHCAESHRFYHKNKKEILKKQKEWRSQNSKKYRGQQKEWRLKNPEKLRQFRKKYNSKNLEKRRADSRNRYHKNPGRVKEINKQWKIKNPGRVIEIHRKWVLNNIEKVRKKACEHQKRKRATLQGNLDLKMAWQIWNSLRGNKAGRHWETLVNYNLEELKKHLESQFTNEMNWRAFMQGKIHIHHIIPRFKFHFESVEDEQFKQCWALENLKPLWKKDHIELHRKRD